MGEESTGRQTLDDQALVERAKNGDTTAFGILYERHIDKVYSYIFHLVGNKTETEDLTEEVFLKAISNLKRFTWKGSLIGWLITIARNEVTDHWRKNRKLTSLIPEKVRNMQTAPDNTLEEREMKDSIRNAASQLTGLQQQVLALRFASGMSLGETAKIMKKSETGIKNLQFKALAGLRRLLEKRC